MPQAVLVLCLLAAIVHVSAWLPTRTFTRRGSLAPLLCASDDSDDAPSDMDSSLEAEYDAIEFESPPKAFLLGDSSTMTRSEVNEYVLALEKMNPTEDPAYSSLLNGVWEVVASGFGDPALLGFQAIKAASKFGGIVDASDIDLTISSLQPRVTAKSTISAGPAKVEFAVTTDLEILNGSKIKENYVSAKVGKVDLPISQVTSLSRELIITYLDQELCISRDQFGSPEILRRKGSPVPPAST